MNQQGTREREEGRAQPEGKYYAIDVADAEGGLRSDAWRRAAAAE